jgi:hypothetical protein
VIATVPRYGTGNKSCLLQAICCGGGEGKNLEMFAAENLSLSFSKDFSCRVRRYLDGSGPGKTITSSTLHGPNIYKYLNVGFS